MKRIFIKLIGVLTAVCLFVLSFAGCSISDKMVLLDAMEKMMAIKSMESESNISVRVDIEGIPKEQRQGMEDFLQAIGNMNMKINQRVWENESGTISESGIDAAISAGTSAFSSSVWTKADISGQIPEIKQIMKIPEDLSELLPPDYSGKRYMVIDQSEMQDNGGLDAAEYRNMLEAVNKFQPRLIDFMKEYAKDFDPDFAVISGKGKQIVNGRELDVYELRLNDDSFKRLMRYSVDNLSKSENFKVILKEFAGVVVPAAGGTEAGVEMDQAFDRFRNGSSSFRQDLYKVLNALDKVRLLGDRGITVNIGVDENGYILNQNGYADFIIDMKAIEAALSDITGTAEEEPGDGVQVSGLVPTDITVSFSIDFNTEIKNINKGLRVDFPVLTENNSFSFNELMSGFAPDPDFPGEIPEESVGIIIDNEWSDITPVMMGELALVPVDEISHELGAQYRSESENVYVTKAGKTIVFKAGDINADINGKTLEMEFPVITVGEQTFVPLDFIAENLGAEVSYNEFGNIVIKTE
ncbi:MAG: copper amine oxidase N-terminal domain-containing protein [Clostridia bacterium]|nr:copper amine oxidase N-terminal domain-containing protein [Clostridia bacterium]